MKKITFILLLLSSFTYGQKSVLYNKNRQLIVDTSLKIDEHTYKNLAVIESEVLPEIYNNIKLSWFLQKEGKSGLVIVKLLFSQGFCGFDIVRSKNAVFEKAVYGACKIMQQYYAALHRNEEYMLYVPIKFELLPNTFQKDLKKNKAITIKRPPFNPLGFSMSFTHNIDVFDRDNK